MTKRFLPVFLAVILILTAAGCSGKTAKEDPKTKITQKYSQINGYSADVKVKAEQMDYAFTIKVEKPKKMVIEVTSPALLKGLVLTRMDDKQELKYHGISLPLSLIPMGEQTGITQIGDLLLTLGELVSSLPVNSSSDGELILGDAEDDSKISVKINVTNFIPKEITLGKTLLTIENFKFIT